VDFLSGVVGGADEDRLAMAYPISVKIYCCPNSFSFSVVALEGINPIYEFCLDFRDGFRIILHQTPIEAY